MYVDYKEVGKRIASRRRELGLKQWQVTEMADISDKYLSNLERATSVMSVDVLMKLCNVLKTTPDYLLLGTTEIRSQQEYEQRLNMLLAPLSDKQLNLVLNFAQWITSQDI